MTLKITDLSCARGDKTLFSHLNFTLTTGELLHLKGHNGSGKTTLIRALCGLIIPIQGDIQWHNQNIQHHRPYLQNLLYLGHKNAIKADLNSIDNLLFNCALSGQVVSEQAAWKALEQMGLKGREELPARVLSQGQQRRLGLARLLLSKHPLWILDEPLTALDTAAVVLLENTIQQHIEQQGMVILTTHQDTHLDQIKMKTLTLGVTDV